jgi:hypothetical protein
MFPIHISGGIAPDAGASMNSGEKPPAQSGPDPILNTRKISKTVRDVWRQCVKDVMKLNS